MLKGRAAIPIQALGRWSVSLTGALPRGGSLPEGNWRRRHRSICLLLWIHVPVLIFFGAVVSDQALGHTVLEAGIVAVLAFAASLPNPNRNQRAVMATLGLMSCSAILTHFSHGSIEMHFHFFVMVVVVSLYQSWVPFLVALGYVVTHHGLFGWLDPSSVYNHPAAVANPWKWALVHGFFILGESVACLVAWRLNEDALEGERAARGAMEKANVDLAEAQAISQVGSWDWDIASGAVWWSDELYRIAGVEPESFHPTFESFLELVHPDERGRVKDIIDLACESRGRLDYECRIVRADGTTRVIQALGECVIGDDGVLRKLIGTCQDVTDRKILEQEIQHRAFHDSLTGLANRALFLNRVEHALAVRERSPAPLAVLYLDLDDFKTVNDSLGHDVGDELLVEVSKRLTNAVRPSDTVARLGGDEFALLLEHTEQEGANVVSERILTALQEPVSLQSKDVFPHASIGVAVAEESPKPDDLLRNADIAMYAAKRQGKNSFRAFQKSMLSSVVTRLELKAELKRAIENREFVLHYQPLIDLETGNIDKVEALIRWDHPDRGLVPPADFIPLAEETGQIVPLGAWVIREATRQAKTLEQSFGRPISVSVNLSARQLDSNIVDQVRDALLRSQLEPGNLVLEITETTLMSQEETIMSRVEELRKLGVRIAIDDFGTGYSSLGYLKQLPIDIIKVDRTFVSCITDGPEESALAHAIIKLAHIFNLEAVGEGIETAEQAEALRELGCHTGQGFYFCRPINAAELMEMALSWNDPLPVPTAAAVP
jgi:diguanylate cyclase (GGDEF)-like protein/PAS domain S-box-containing protein